MMLLQVFHLYRTEGPQPYMKGHIGNINPLLLQLLQKLLCKMKPCGGRCSRSLVPGINSLVTVLVLELMGNVGRQGHFPQPVQYFFPDPFIVELYESVSFLHHLQHFRMKQAVPKYKFSSRPGFFTRLDQRFPDIIFPAFQEKDLYGSSGLLSHTHKPGRYYLGVI